MNYKLWFWVLNIVLTVLRLLLIGKVGLTIDEAHYWVYAKFLDLSYFDHPPFIAYLIKASTLIFGNNEFAVRFPVVLIFFFASWILFMCTKKLYNEKTAFVAIVLLNVLPLFSFFGSVIAVPDSPLALFWMLALFVFILLIETNNKNYWYLLGIVVGLAMLSKYNAIFIPFSIFMFLVLSPHHRFWFKRKEPYLAVIISILMFLPVIVWNIENNWASFGFQLNHGLGSSWPKFSFTLFGKSIGAQVGYVSPLLFLLFIAASFLCVKEAYQKKDRPALIIACFSLPILIFFNGVATFNEILPHWPAMGYLVLSIYAARLTLKFWHIKWFRMYSYAAWALALFMTIIAPLHVLYRILPIEKFIPKNQIEKVKHGILELERIDVTNEVYGWKEVGNEIRKILNSYPPNERPFVFTYKSYLASELAASVPELIVFCINDKADAYDFWQRNLHNLKNKTGLFICNDYFFVDPREEYGDKVFTSYTDVEDFPVYRSGRKIKNFFFTLCRSFNPSNLLDQYTSNIIGTKKKLFQELIKFDYAVFKFINSDLKCKFLDFCATPISYCDVINFNVSFFAILIFSIVMLWKNKKDNFWTIIALLASALAITIIATYFLKHYFERFRPSSVFGDENVNTLVEKMYRYSFPSGHASIAVAVCAFMFMIVRKYWYCYIIFALFSGFYRIYAGSHFPSDVLCGALIGILSAYLTVNSFRKYSKNLRTSSC
jgi:4-amino-4-deoxy-L-arabinose transferase-like glycosyltransferase